MENFINEAKSFMASDQGKQMESMLEKTTGFSPSNTSGSSGSASGSNDPSASAGVGFNNNNDDDSNDNSTSSQGLSSDDRQQQQQDVRGAGGREQDYTGYGEEGDSSISSGGYGANNQGDSYSRQNQMGADFTSNTRPESSDAQRTNYDAPSYHPSSPGGGTGTSTPAYRQEDDGYGGSPSGGSTRQLGDGGRSAVGAGSGAGQQTQGGGGSTGLNPYGDNEPEI